MSTMEYIKDIKTKGLIFDLDGTLADTMPIHFKAWQLACQKYGMDMDSSFLKQRMGRPAWEIGRDIIQEYKLEASVDHEKLFKDKIEFFKTLQGNIVAVEPVADIVRKFHGKIKMSVGTGSIRESAHRTLDMIGFSEYFDIVITADDVTIHKPHPETFLKCAELMQVDPSNVEVFEDGDLGLEAASKAGMKPIDIRPWIEEW